MSDKKKVLARQRGRQPRIIHATALTQKNKERNIRRRCIYSGNSVLSMPK
ncbi:unknown protein [Cronobacter turicensis z3032]|uniref:Uncharacterized protein n=1 Tax=Cronobacter turicensis (strain DSM 18703 / CCUG 55852 / LMG 23827 / z3032) TaxID=693216 RepID=C9XX43_CROTZ|nr:unknown protein [Cronobacter turicensis z3032]